MLINLYKNNIANFQLLKWYTGCAGQVQSLWPANYVKKLSGLQLVFSLYPLSLPHLHAVLCHLSSPLPLGWAHLPNPTAPPSTTWTTTALSYPAAALIMPASWWQWQLCYLFYCDCCNHCHLTAIVIGVMCEPLSAASKEATTQHNTSHL